MPIGKMTLEEKAGFAPSEKYMRFGRFTWKMIFHIILVAFLTSQAQATLSLLQKHNRILQQQFSALFLGTQLSTTETQLYDLQDFQGNINRLFSSLNDLNTTLFQKVKRKQIKGHISSLDLFLSQQQQPTSWPINISSGAIRKPFDIEKPESIKSFLKNTRKFSITFQDIVTIIQSHDVMLKEKEISCLNWTVVIDYDVQSVIQASLSTAVRVCSDESAEYFKSSATGLHIAVLIFSLLNLVFNIFSIYEHYAQLKQSQEKYSYLISGQYQLDAWIYFGIMSNIVQIVGAAVALRDETFVSDNSFNKELMVGLGCLFGYVGLLKYFDKVAGKGLMAGTLQKMSKQFIYFLAGVVPLFMFFSTLGLCLFWRYQFFESIQASSLSLFGMFNGDVMNDTAQQLQGARYIGMLFEVGFVVVFYSAVQTVLITIIIEGHDQVIKDEQKLEKYEFNKQEERIRYQQRIFQEGMQVNQSGNVEERMMVNERKIRIVLNELMQAGRRIKRSGVDEGQKRYLLELLKESIQDRHRNIQFQLISLQS